MLIIRRLLENILENSTLFKPQKPLIFVIRVYGIIMPRTNKLSAVEMPRSLGLGLSCPKYWKSFIPLFKR